MSAADMTCPHCATDMRGDEIAECFRTHRDDCALKDGRLRCFCFPYGEATHYSRVMGHEIRGVYDGVLFWSCPDCGLAWPRWNDGGRLSRVGAHEVARHNAAINDRESA
jgi:hypothetical protein